MTDRPVRPRERRRPARRVTQPQRIAVWEAINQVVRASGGDPSNTSLARQRAVVLVERALDAIAAGNDPCWCQHECGDSPCPTHGMESA